jgi:peroxiredoxin
MKQRTKQPEVTFRRIIITTLLFCLSTTFAWSQQSKSNASVEKIEKQKNAVNLLPDKAEDISPLLIGESIPELNLLDATGKSVDLNKIVAASPSILIFYRGGWCPYCSKQLSGIQEIESELTDLGYNIIAISTDSPENLSKTLGKEQLTYTLLSDSDLAAAKKFGIAFKVPESYTKLLSESSGGKNKDRLLPVSSVFILDTKGIIQFEYINPNYKERISPGLLKAAASALIDDSNNKKK